MVLAESSFLPLMLELRIAAYRTGACSAGGDRCSARLPHCSVLDPGQVPEIKGVTRSVNGAQRMYIRGLLTKRAARFPAHEHISGASKIPSIIYYDRNGKVQAVGAEAMRDGVYEQAQDEEWVKAEW
jgi:hypothetical protein